MSGHGASVSLRLAWVMKHDVHGVLHLDCDDACVALYAAVWYNGT
jgi:hypothetical protein